MKLHSKIKFSITIFVLGFLLYLPGLVHAATLELSLEKNIVSNKDDVVILIAINSEDQDVNTAQATISFPASLLEVTNIDRKDSVFSFWLQEPVYDNSKGTISFVGGSISGFKGASLKLMRVSFKVKGSGAGRLGITDGAITASDGTGSNVYNTSKGLDINIPSTADFQAVKLERAKQQATIAKELPALLGLSVPFYPDSTKWNIRSASFSASWNISSDTTDAAVALNKNPVFTPVANTEALLGNKIFSALADGVWYLHIRIKNNIGWSSVLHYRLAIDTTPPNSFKVTSSGGFKTAEAKPTINFASSDLTSGIDNYVILLDGVINATTSSNKYQFPPLLPGIHQLTVRAIDKAGNSTSETETLEILPITSPTITYVNRSVIVDEGGINAGGTALVGVEVVVQIQNSQKQIVFEQVVPVDANGGWNIFINKSLTLGNYNLLVTARDKNMASSFPVISDAIKIKLRPILTIGTIEINQLVFFTSLIVILLILFTVGWFIYSKWRGQLGKKVIIAQRDVINIFNNVDKDLNKLLEYCSNNILDKSKISEMKIILKDMKDNLEKSHRFIIENIKEINE